MKEKILRFYRLYRVYILTVISVSAIVLIAFIFWPKSAESRIVSAIESYHISRLAGESVESVDVSNLRYQRVPGTWPDSVLYESLILRSRQLIEYSGTVSQVIAAKARRDLLESVYGGSHTPSYVDSIDYEREYKITGNEIDNINNVLQGLGERITANRKSLPRLTRCDYVVRIVTEKENRVDSVTLVIDSLHNVVWPVKK